MNLTEKALGDLFENGLKPATVAIFTAIRNDDLLKESNDKVN